MRYFRAASLMLLVLAASGCFGGSSAHSGSSEPGSSSATARKGPAPAPAQLMVDYWVGMPERSRGLVSRACPALGHCTVARLRGYRPARWALEVRRTLSCTPAGGDYIDPARACRALVQYLALTAHGSTCFCPVQLLPGGRVTGLLHGHRIRVYVDFCAACGHGRAAARDVAIVTPGEGA